MSVTGIDEVTGRLQAVLDRARYRSSEKALTEFLIAAGAQAAFLTPVDTSALINSQGREVQPMLKGWQGVIYYGAEYAPWVHEMSGKLKGQPREDFGTTRAGVSFGGGTGGGNYWDPNGEPDFLEKGVEKAKNEDLPGIIRRNYSI